MLSEAMALVPRSFRAKVSRQFVFDAVQKLLDEMVVVGVTEAVRCALREWLTPICEQYFARGGIGAKVPVMAARDYQLLCRQDRIDRSLGKKDGPELIDWTVLNSLCYRDLKIYAVDRACPSNVFRFLSDAQQILDLFALEVVADAPVPVMSTEATA